MNRDLDDLESTLEPRLRQLATVVRAPADDTARDVVRGRTGKLRLRRRIRYTTGTGLVASTLVVGAVIGTSWGDEDAPDITTGVTDTGETDGQSSAQAELPPVELGEPWDPPPTGDGTLPAFTIDGFAHDYAQEHNGPDGIPDDNAPETVDRLFRQPDNHSGPTIVVRHIEPCDADDRGIEFHTSDQTDPDAPEVGSLQCASFFFTTSFGNSGEAIDINGNDGMLWPDGARSSGLTWELDDGSVAVVRAIDLTPTEVIAFAQGLEAEPGQLGFEPTVLPQAIEEAPIAAVPEGQPVRQSNLTSLERGFHIEFWAERGDENLLVGNVPWGRGVDSIERTDVLGRPAALIQLAEVRDLSPEASPSSGWLVVWRHTDDAVVTLGLYSDDLSRQEVDEIIDGIEELDEDDWQHLTTTTG